jgi:hypothetical protein
LPGEFNHLIRQAADFDLRAGRLDAPSVWQFNFRGLRGPRGALRVFDVLENRIVGRALRKFPQFAIQVFFIIGIIDATFLLSGQRRFRGCEGFAGVGLASCLCRLSCSSRSSFSSRRFSRGFGFCATDCKRNREDDGDRDQDRKSIFSIHHRCWLLEEFGQDHQSTERTPTTA